MNIEKKEKNNNENLESTKGIFFDKPDCDIYETNDEYKMYFDMPGVEKEDINLKIEKDVLTLTAECNKKPIQDYQCVREEMEFNGYKRSFELNNIVNTENITANYENGTLILTLPKLEKQKTKEIKVNIA